MRSVLFNAIPDALLIVDAGGTVVMVNDAAVRLFCYERQDLVGSQVETLLPGALRDRHRQHRANYALNRRERTMGATEMQLLGQARDGRQFPVEIALKPVRVGRQWQTLASIRDVSETHLARRVLRRSRYDAASLRIGQLAVGVARGNEAELIVAVISETLKCGPVMLLERAGTTGSFKLRAGVSFVSHDWVAREGAGICELVVEGAQVLAPHTLPADIVMPKGMLSGLAAPLGDADAALAGVIIAFSRIEGRFDSDATHFLDTAASLIRAMDQRRVAEEQLAHAQRLDAVGRLTSGVAHDFNNLLMVVSGNLQLLEASIHGDAESNEMIDTALRAVDRGAALTRKLLSFAGRQHLRPQPVDLAKLVADLQRLILASIGERIALTLDVEPELPLAYVDPALFDSALLNLVLNARDAVNGAGEITISVRANPLEEDAAASGSTSFVMVAVKDTGSGMSKEVMDRMFEPFFTTKASGSGTGLGLSMVYGFARQSGGDVRVESQAGHGTCIALLLPVATEANCFDVVEATLPVRGGDELVLVVEDDEAVRRTVAASLQALGYAVMQAANAESALAQLWATPDIALLFSDVGMEGGMTGYELARSARTTYPQLKVLLTSGYEDAVPHDGLARFPMLAKPYRRDELAAAVRNAIDRTPEAITF